MDPASLAMLALKFLPMIISAGSALSGGGGGGAAPMQTVQQGPTGGVGGNHPAPIAAPGTYAAPGPTGPQDRGMFGMGSEQLLKNPMGALGGLGMGQAGQMPLGLLPALLQKQGGGMGSGLGLIGSLFGH